MLRYACNHETPVQADVIHLYYLTWSRLLTGHFVRRHLGRTADIHSIDAHPVAGTARISAHDPGVMVICIRNPTDPGAPASVPRAAADRHRLAGAVRIGRLLHAVFRLRRDPR